MARLLSILLQRSDPWYEWGFTVQGGAQEGTPLTIHQVTPGTLAAQYLAPGDTILQIEKVDTRQLWHSQVESLLSQPGKSLDLLVQKNTGETNVNARSYSSPQPQNNNIRDQKSRKQDFWSRISAEKPDYCKETFTRLEGEDSPYRVRSPRVDQWKRCHSEERYNNFENSSNSIFSESIGRSRKMSDAGFDTSKIRSVWSPTPSDNLKRTPTPNSFNRGDEERQGDITFWEYTPDQSSVFKSENFNKDYKSEHNKTSHEQSSFSSGYATSSGANSLRTESPFEMKQGFMKKPSDFWEDSFKDASFRKRFEQLTSPIKDLEKLWTKAKLSSKSEFKRSTSLSEKTYSSRDGSKSFETYEHLNKSKDTEKTIKKDFKGKEEVFEKTKKNKEYILANKDDLDGKPKESTKIIQDSKLIEKVKDGNHEFCTKSKERSEEVIDNSTPVNFYDNVQTHHEGPSKVTVCKSSNVPESFQQEKDDRSRNYYAKSDNEEDDLRSFSPLFSRRNLDARRWLSSTPIPEQDDEDKEDSPLQENYFEVDIRSPLDTQVFYPSADHISSGYQSKMSGGKVDPTDPKVRRLVYNMYRDILGQYNDKANSMINALPRHCVTEDKGITGHIESMIRQSSQISGGGSPVPTSPQGETQVAPPPPPPCPPAPPPPPPPGLPGAIPGVRLSTEIPEKRRTAYEPPAAIQNAMMTKDKKPFTYTPGGLDLSEIRSPRMARRINRNMNAPDSAPSQPRPMSVPNQPLPPSAMAAMQPQIAIPVFPQGGVNLTHVHPPPPPPPPKTSPPIQNIPPPPPFQPQAQQAPTPPPYKIQTPSPQIINRQPSPPLNSVPKIQPQHRHTKSEPQSTPGSIYIPPIEQHQTRAQLGSLYIPPVNSQEPVKPATPVSQLNKAPTPWLSRPTQQSPREVPSWAHKEDDSLSPPPQQQSQSQNQQQKTRIIPIQFEGKEQQSSPNTRIIPIQMEGTPSPQPTPPNYHQPPVYPQQPHMYQQQPSMYQQQPSMYQQQPPMYQQIPVYQQQPSYEQQSGRQTPQTPRWANQQPVYVHNKFNGSAQSPAPSDQSQVDGQPNWRHSQSNGTLQSQPVQSRSFKVLEKITGTDNGEVDQLRRLQLSDDDRALMNKVKSQVDDEVFLHKESDPRYRGSAIPSRAFRMLQTMTDSASDDSDVPRAYSPAQNQNRISVHKSQQNDTPQQHIPASEQQAPEPRKYTGGAIPSRSFRMLQAMTGSEASAAPSDGRNTPQFCNGGEVNWAPYPPLPPDPNSYYYPPNYPQTLEQQQQFWEHYNAMCSYMAEMSQNYNYPPYGYPPHLYTPPPPPNVQYTSDSDECGYSSTDEMNYYAAFFKKYPPPIQPYRGYYQENRAQTPKIIITPSNSNTNSQDRDLVFDSDQEQSDQSSNQCSQSSPSVNEDSEATTDGSDTEVEEETPSKPLGLQTIKSVPDISVYKDCSITDIQSLNSDDDDDEEEECNEGEVEEEYDEEEQQDLPHQLSVIFEESETSETESIKKIKKKDPEEMETTSEGESSTATLDHGNDDTDDDEIDTESSTVLVRLPLKLQFSKTENNEEVTTVIVGDSEIQASQEDDVREGDLIIQEVTKDEEEPEVSVTFTIPKKRNKSLDESVTSLVDISLVVNKSEMAEQLPKTNDELRDDDIPTDRIQAVYDKDNETSVVVNSIDNCNEREKQYSSRSRSESPVDFWKELSCDDIPAKRNDLHSDINVNITLAPKCLSKSGSRSPYENLNSESDESRPEESDGHWEDDSSSTSVQTVRIGKRSGSDNFSSSEFETAGTAEETEEETKISILAKTTDNNDKLDKEPTNENELHEEIEDESNNIPIEDLLYNDDSSSSNDDDDDESSSTSSSSESSGESESEESKEVEETATTSTGSSSRAEEKMDDDVFLHESIKIEGNNHLAVEQKPRKNRGSSCKSHDESEEDDSGVTSDMSRHISETDTDPECGSELRKLTPYQRASTHSRLFKLLQDECSQDEDANDADDKPHFDNCESLISRKEKLSLPLQTTAVSDQDSMSSSSGINSPASPTVSDRLVKELVQSLLHKKKGRHFKKLPMDKLYAAALRILKEDMDPYDTVSSTSDDSFRYSPISDSTVSQTNNNTATNHLTQNNELYGGNYYDYRDYYNTWGNPYYYTGVEDSLGYDIIPSRAFRLLQERAQTPHGFSSGAIEGLTAKCPRVPNSKEVPREVVEALLPDPSPQTSSSSET